MLRATQKSILESEQLRVPMRLVGALMPMLLWSLSGCAWLETAEPSSFMKRFREQPFAPDHTLLEVAIIERPIGDAYLNKGIWEHTAELFGNLERQAVLDDNGLRVGQLVGTPPMELQQLLVCKSCCLDLRARIFPAGQSRPIFLTSVLPQSTYVLVQGQQRTEIALDQARYALEMHAEFCGEGTKLTFTPKVEHGEMQLPFRPAPERGRWEYRLEKAAKSHPELNWEVTLGQNQYLVIGARLDHERSFGQTAFTHPAEEGLQRLVVIRNCRSVSATEAHQNSVEELLRADQTPPLALQATMSAYRAKSP